MRVRTLAVDGIVKASSRAAIAFLRQPLLPLLLVAAIALSGCNAISRATGSDNVNPGFQMIRGSGNIITKDLAYKDFTEVEVASAFTVDLVRGEDYQVSVTADDNLFEYLDVFTQGQTLHVRMKSGSYANSATWKAKITMPTLHRLEMSGATKGTLSGFKSADNVEFEISGASRLTGRLDAGNLSLVASGASATQLGGSTANLNLEVSGASRADLGDLPTNDVQAKLSGASNATVNPGGRLNADVSGASTLSYVGNPTLGQTTTSGASAIKRR